MSKETRKSCKVLGAFSIYVDKSKHQTIIRNNISNRSNVLLDFQAQEIVKAGEGSIFLDHASRILYVWSEEKMLLMRPVKIPFDAIVDIQVL